MKLDSLIKEYLIERGDSQLNQYFRALQIGVSGLRELNMDVSGAPTAVELEIDHTLDTCNLPLDYIQYTRIAVCGADGNAHSLALNNDMCLPRSADDCGNPAFCENPNATGGGIGNWDMPVDNYRNGECLGRFFGLGGAGNANGYYRIDKQRNTINLQGIPANSTCLLLEYIGSLQKVNGSYQVHPFAVEALKMWINWKFLVFDKSAGQSSKSEAERMWYNARRSANNRFQSGTVEEWLYALRKDFSLAPRF